MENEKPTNSGCGKLLLIALGILVAIILIGFFVSANEDVGDALDAIIIVVLIIIGIYLIRS